MTDVVDHELEKLVIRRAGSDRRPCPDSLEPSYADSVRRHNAKIRRENRGLWREHHQTMYRAHSRLASEHAEKAEALAGGGGKL